MLQKIGDMSESLHCYMKYCILDGVITAHEYVYHLRAMIECYTILCYWDGLALVQVKACRLFGAQPSPKQIPTYNHLDSKEHT